MKCQIQNRTSVGRISSTNKWHYRKEHGIAIDNKTKTKLKEHQPNGTYESCLGYCKKTFVITQIHWTWTGYRWQGSPIHTEVFTGEILCVVFALKPQALLYPCQKTDRELKIVKDGWQLQGTFQYSLCMLENFNNKNVLKQTKLKPWSLRCSLKSSNYSNCMWIILKEFMKSQY